MTSTGASSKHPYGAADDVPDLLRALPAPDQQQASASLSASWNRVRHQGGSSAPAALAVRFLLRAAADRELFGNSVRHSRPGAAGGTVAVRTGGGLVRVEVTDRSGPEVPELYATGRDAEAAGSFSSLRAWRRGGGGGSVADRR